MVSCFAHGFYREAVSEDDEKKNSRVVHSAGLDGQQPPAVEGHGLRRRLRVEESESVFLENGNGDFVPPFVAGVHGTAEVDVTHRAAASITESSEKRDVVEKFSIVEIRGGYFS